MTKTTSEKMARSELSEPTTVDHEGCARDPARHGAHQEQDGVGNIVGSANASQRTIRGFPHESVHVLAQLGALAEQHGSFNVSGAHAVHADIVLAVVACHRPRQVHTPSLGGAIRRGPRASLKRPSGTDVHDAASSVADHGGANLTRQEMDGLKGEIKGEIPFVLREVDDSFANCDTGRVAENVDFLRTLDRALNRTPAVSAVAHVALQEDRIASARLDFFDALAASNLVNVEHRNECTHFRQTQRNPAPDPRW